MRKLIKRFFMATDIDAGINRRIDKIVARLEVVEDKITMLRDEVSDYLDSVDYQDLLHMRQSIEDHLKSDIFVADLIKRINALQLHPGQNTTKESETI